MINNVSFIKKFIIICLIFAGFGLYADDLNPDKERVIRGANVAFQISAPKRWVFDNKPGSKLLIYPSEYSNDNTPIVIYAMAGPPQCTKTDDLIKSCSG